MTVALTEARKEEIYRQASLARAFDVEAHPVSPEEALAMYPHLNIDGVVGAVHLPADGQADPANIALALPRVRETASIYQGRRTRHSSQSGRWSCDRCPVGIGHER